MFQNSLLHDIQKANTLEHRGGDYAGGNTHIMDLELRTSIFLESENWSSDGIWETSVKPLISINPSARGLHLKKKTKNKFVSEDTFTTKLKFHT